MKMRNVAIVALALVVPVSLAWAQKAKPVDPDKLPQVKCSEMHFGKAFLDKYPHAPAACQDVRVYKGKKYAKFSGKVYLTSADSTTIQLLNVAGDPLTTFSFKPRPGQSIKINGKDVKFTDLQKGETISFWVPEDRMVAQSLPSATRDQWTVTPPVN